MGTFKYEYGEPTPPRLPATALSDRPRCWGKSLDETSRECRGCGFQASCRDEMIRQNVNRPLAVPPVPQYYGTPSHPYTVPQPVPVTLRPMAVTPQALESAARTVVPAPRPVAAQPQTQQYGYGWLNDPMFMTVHSAPPPMRPQLPGESFFERVMKNVGLSLLEQVFKEGFLAVRQMILPPTPKETVVDVQPSTQQVDRP